MQKKVKKVIKAAAVLVTLSLGFLNPLQAQEEDLELSSVYGFVPHSQDKYIFIYNYIPKIDAVGVKGYYKIIASPFYSLDANQNKTGCSDLLEIKSNSNVKDYFFNQVLKFKTNQSSYSQVYLVEKGCVDLNEDKLPELILWGNETESKEKYPLVIIRDSENFRLIPFSLFNNPIHDIKLRPLLENDWLQLILLDTSRVQDDKEIIVRPMSFNPESREYAPSKFIYDPDTETIFSTEGKKLADSLNFNLSGADSISLNRAGDLLGYIHTEAAAQSSYFVCFVASFDIKAKKFRHIEIFNNPNFNKSVNQKYPGFLKRASQNTNIESDPIEIKTVGFQKRDLIFKVHVSSINETKFCGYWKFNVDTGQIGIVSWDSSASLNVEHTGLSGKIIWE